MTTTLRKALLLINPASRNGAEAELQQGIEKLEKAGVTLVHIQSKNAKHAREQIKKFSNEIDFVIMGGGDGTISSAARCLYESKLPFAILPLGTANDLARSLGIPTDLDQAFEVIINNERRHIDLGCVNDHLFFNVANIGLGVHITHELTPEVKKTWGVFSYLKALISALDYTEIFTAELVIDGKLCKLRSIHLGVGNGRFYGGGNVIDDECTIDNGLLSLYSLKPQGFWDLLTLAPLLRSGKQNQAKRTFTARAKRIEVKTRKKKDIHADGEPVTHTPATFTIIHHALQVIAPKKMKDATP